MNKQEALEFLKKHQPLPKDSELTEELITEYDLVREYFLENPDKACIPLFLKSFGDKDGLGVYQLVENVLLNFPKVEVLPFLMEAFESKHISIRYWATEISAVFPDEELIDYLESNIEDADVDIRLAALTALGQIRGERVKDILIPAIKKEHNSDVLQLFADILSKFEKKRDAH